MGNDISYNTTVVITVTGKQILSDLHSKAKYPSQELIRRYSGLSQKTIRAVYKRQRCQFRSIELLYTVLAILGNQPKARLIQGVHYSRVGVESSSPKTSTKRKKMTYSDLLDTLKEQELQGKCGMVVDQATNLALMPPSLLLKPDRAILSPMGWIKPKPFDFTKYWHISGSEAVLRQLKAMQPGQSKEVEYCMFRVPRLVDGEWYTELCRYHQTYYCVDLGYTHARVSSSNPNDYEVVRPATKAEVDALRQP